MADSTSALALVYRHVVYVTGACVDLARTGDLEFGIIYHLHPLGHPTRGAWYGEHDGEGVRRYPEGFVDEPRVEVYVRIELAAREVIVVERPVFELDGDVEQRALLVRGLQHLVDVAADDPGARVVVLVHPVPEAHETLVALLDAFEEVWNVLDTSDALEHPEDRDVGTAMQRTVEPGAARGYGREGVDPGRPHDPHGGGRTVLLVVGVQDEEHVERLLQARVRLVLGLGHLEEHGQEVARIREVVVGVDVRQPEAVTVGKRGKGRHLGDKTHRRNVALVLIVDIFGLGVEGGEGADGSLQHPHRVRVVTEAVHEVLDVLVDVGVMGDLIGPLIELVLGWEPAVDEQIGHLEVRRMLAELLDGDAPMLQDPLLPINVGDGAPATRRVGVAGVVGHEAEIVFVDLDLPEVHGPDRAVFYLDFVTLARPIVRDR